MADALSQKSSSSLAHIQAIQTLLQNKLRSLLMELMFNENNFFIAHLKVKPIHLDKIQEAQNNDSMMVKLKQQVKDGVRIDFQIKDDDVLIMRNRLCVP